MKLTILEKMIVVIVAGLAIGLMAITAIGVSALAHGPVVASASDCYSGTDTLFAGADPCG